MSLSGFSLPDFVPRWSAGEPEHARMLSIAAAIAAVTVVGFGLSLSIPLLTFELERRGISPTWIGLNTATAGIANILMAPLVPYLLRHFGVVKLLIGAGVAGAVSLLAFKLAGPFWLWFPLRFVAGGALCVVFVVSEFWINSAAPENRRGLVMGIYATMLAVGFAAGPVLLAVVGTTGLLPFAIGTVIMLLAMIPVVAAGPLVPTISATSQHSVGRFLLIAPTATLAALVFGAVETGSMSFLPLLGLRLGMNENAAALLLSAAMLGNVAFQIPIGWLSDRADRRLVLAGCGAAGAIGALAMTVVPSGWSFMALVFVWGGIVASLYTVGLAHLGSRYRGADLASANAAFIMLYSVGFTFGPPGLGAAMDAWSPWGFPVALAAALGLYTLVVVVRRKLHPQQP
ncbi:MFS transporter [Blastochloris tepida]|uniref:ABC transporter permease n=1 Tax=Blastochloris tepida TaxID=2233851 RepID=A0A348G102_9HYPH|nr:MFS transporter [Blastochloris tepida]BBF93235.1 ABC transporter permease [Blastochloris tepida]